MSFTPLVSYEGANSGRGLSPGLWAKQPRDFQDLSVGFGFVDDFLSFDDGSNNWKLTAATSGTAALDTAAKGGVLLLDAGAVTNNQGPQVQFGGEAAASSFIASASSRIYFEARLKLATIGSTTIQFFGGLAEVDSTVLASAANDTANHIGFECFNTTTLSFATEKAGARAVDTSAGTIADGTYVKIGFVVDGVSKVTPYVNGVAGTAITTGSANIPVVALTPSISVHAAGTNRPVGHVDWVACYQEEQIDN